MRTSTACVMLGCWRVPGWLWGGDSTVDEQHISYFRRLLVWFRAGTEALVRVGGAHVRGVNVLLQDRTDGIASQEIEVMLEELG